MSIVVVDGTPEGSAASTMREVPPIVGQGLLMSLLLGAISTTAAAFTPRRLYATVAIVVLLAVTPIITQLLEGLGVDSLLGILVLLSPGDVLEGSNAFLFGTRPESQVLREAGHDGPVYVAAALVGTAACLTILVRRYQRIAA